MLDWITETSLWPPRWSCGRWDGWLGWAAIGSNAGFALAYALIPLAGWRLIRRRPTLLPDNALAYWCIGFVVLCGLSHVMDALMFWWPAYRLNVLLRAVGAVVSVWTVGEFVRRWDRVAAYKSPAEYAGLLREADEQRRLKHDLADRLEQQNRALLVEIVQLKAASRAAVAVPVPDPYQTAHAGLIGRLEAIVRGGVPGA